MNHFIRIIGLIICLFLTSYQCQASDISLDEISEGLSSNESDIKDAEPGPHANKSKAKLIILNKITAKSELVEFRLGETKYFGNLSVEVKKCVKKTDPLNSSSLMLVSIFDNKPDDDKKSVFQGWIDSSNLSISTIEHPIYEIIPKECID